MPGCFTALLQQFLPTLHPPFSLPAARPEGHGAANVLLPYWFFVHFWIVMELAILPFKLQILRNQLARCSSTAYVGSTPQTLETGHVLVPMDPAKKAVGGTYNPPFHFPSDFRSPLLT